MKTVFCDLCGQQLTEAEVEGTARLPAEPGQRWWRQDDALLMWPQIRRKSGGAPAPALAGWGWTNRALHWPRRTGSDRMPV